MPKEAFAGGSIRVGSAYQRTMAMLRTRLTLVAVAFGLLETACTIHVTSGASGARGYQAHAGGPSRVQHRSPPTRPPAPRAPAEPDSTEDAVLQPESPAVVERAPASHGAGGLSRPRPTLTRSVPQYPRSSHTAGERSPAPATVGSRGATPLADGGHRFSPRPTLSDERRTSHGQANQKRTKRRPARDDRLRSAEDLLQRMTKRPPEQ